VEEGAMEIGDDVSEEVVVQLVSVVSVGDEE